MDNPVEILDDPKGSEAKDRLHGWIAVSIAVLATFMAVTKVKDDNLVQAMVQAKSDAVDIWAQYQAKRIRQSVLELGRNQASALRLSAQGAAAAQLEEQMRNYDAEIQRYKAEEGELQQKAREKEMLYDALNYRDDQFDLSDAALAVAVAMLAVSALTRRKWLFAMAWVFATFGIAMGTAGLFGLPLHPDWLTRLLS